MWALVTVFLVAMLELWAAIPAGMALQLHPMLVGLTAALGAIVGVLVVMLIGEPLRAWMRRHKSEVEPTTNSRMHRIWARFGVMGLGLLAPLLVGAPLGAALGLALGAPPNKLLLWLVIGAVGWSVLITGVITLGFEGAQALAE
jgi:membrane protein YqaA with SNARE-associated domain